MSEQAPASIQAELRPLLELTQRVGTDPLLTQASTGNSSAKLDGVLWIKASGRWMADALRDDILIPLDLAEVTKCVRRGIDPAERYPSVSLETAMHVALPHSVVLHVHCVNTIAWAVRTDAPAQLRSRLRGLPWQWIPYVASGLPLSRAIERALSVCPDTNIFVLGNHGLVIAAESVHAVDFLLNEVKERVAIAPRTVHSADHAVLFELCKNSSWDLPADDRLHVLGLDPISRAILAGGLLYPCQAIFFGSQHDPRPFLIIGGRGVVVAKSIAPAELAMLSGLAEIVQRVTAPERLRYLTESEVACLSGQISDRYRTLSSVNRRGATGR